MIDRLIQDEEDERFMDEVVRPRVVDGSKFIVKTVGGALGGSVLEFACGGNGYVGAVVGAVLGGASHYLVPLADHVVDNLYQRIDRMGKK